MLHFAERVTFLGFTDSGGVSTDLNKIAAVRDWPTPSNLRQCRAFVVLCQYYRRFIPNFSALLLLCGVDNYLQQVDHPLI